MRRSLWSLAALVAGLAVPLLYQASTAAPPKSTPRTARAVRTTTAIRAVNRIKVTPSNTPASVVRNRSQLRSTLRPGTAFYVVQVRNPQWTRTVNMTPDLAVLSLLNLRRQGFSGHLHNLGDQGVFVHFGMVHWLNRGVTTNRLDANRAAELYRAVGLQARVVSRRA
jgi:hypothetical protein